MRRPFEPDKSFSRGVDPLEVPRGKNRRDLKIVTPQHEDDRHLEPREAIVDMECSVLVPEALQGKPVPLPELDQIDEIRLVCLQGSPNELAGRKPRVKRAAESEDASARVESATGRRRSKMPLIVVAQSPDKAAALAGLERWRERHPAVAAQLAVEDVLIDSMRGRSSTWTRVRINLRHVPEAERPAPEPPEPDDDPTRAWRELAKRRARDEP